MPPTSMSLLQNSGNFLIVLFFPYRFSGQMSGNQLLTGGTGIVRAVFSVFGHGPAQAGAFLGCPSALVSLKQVYNKGLDEDRGPLVAHFEDERIQVMLPVVEPEPTFFQVQAKSVFWQLPIRFVPSATGTKAPNVSLFFVAMTGS